jgi:predicted TIM-barrel fold metal-dependent hydrolase
MVEYGVVSADSHVVEPPDLWGQYIDPAFRDRAPKVDHVGGREAFVIDGLPPEFVGALGLFGSAGVPSERLQEIRVQTDGNPGGWDPHDRLKDMVRDGVDAEVMYPSMGMRLYLAEDPDYQFACFRAYNDWLADLCTVYPDRLFGLGLVSLSDVEAAIIELARVKDRGLRGACISVDLKGGDRPFWDVEYDPFWAQAAELEMPISLHSLTGGERRQALGGRIAQMVTEPAVVQASIANLIEFGVLERFPELKVVSVENDVGWAGTFLARMDYAYQRSLRYSGPGGNLSMLPSEFFHRQVYLTFMYDKPGVDLRHYIGVDNMMWSSDYPHGQSTWPESRGYIEWQFGDLPEEERRKITCDNVLNLYNITRAA